MNYQAESDAVEIKRLRDCYAELSKLHQADRRLDEQRIDTLRARVAELEAVLQRIASGTCACDTFHGCVDARAALGAKGE